MRRGRRSSGRVVHGILLLDKRTGLSSNAALQEVKRLFNAKKAGHTGSLDPLASGLLPVCFGDGTRVSAFLLDTDKRYRVRVQLGVTTTTGDREGEVINTQSVFECPDSELESVLSRFRGEIEQVPPMFSALRQNGVRLYELARQGVEVERAARRITIYELTLLGRPSVDILELDVRCSKGTYIRTLAEDIGTALGCGAHVVDLRRTEVGDFLLDQAYSMGQLDALADDVERMQCLQPIDAAFPTWPAVLLSESLLFYLCRGQAVFVPKAPAHGWLRLYDTEHNFIGVGLVQSDGKIAPKRLFSK